ncbi:hypothetical protein V2J09_016188 [Rumex salicifolius]
MDLWKNKVVTKFKLLLGGKKAAAEANKSFDESKVEINKEFEEKKEDLKPKVIGIYEASSTEIKTLIKEPNVAGLKKHSTKVHKFLEELVAIGFPGSKAVCEATDKCGPVLVSGPIIFVFEKVSTFIVAEEKPTVTTTREIEIPLPVETTPTTVVPPATPGATTEVQAKAVVVELEKAVLVAEAATKEAPAKVEAGKPEEAPKAK